MKMNLPSKEKVMSPAEAGHLVGGAGVSWGSRPASRIGVNLKRIDFKGGGGRFCRIPPAEAGGKFKYGPQTQAPKTDHIPPIPLPGWGEIMKMGSLQ